MSELFNSVKKEFTEVFEIMEGYKDKLVIRFFSFIFAVLIVTLGIKKTILIILLTLLPNYLINNSSMIEGWINPNKAPKSEE